MRRARVAVALVALTTAATSVGAALAQDSKDPVEEHARAVAALVAEKPDAKKLDELFARSFLQAVPPPRLLAILQDVHRKSGPVVTVTRLSGEGSSGVFEFVQERGTRIEVSIAVEAKPPHRIVGLFFKPRAAPAHSFDEVVRAVAKLPGKCSFAVARLGSSSTAILAEHHADDPVAIGSAFKLYVLGALVEDVARGKRRWSDVAALSSERRSLPSGVLQTWPAGSPVTLHTLATLMISQSDNTATDHLLLELGRERVERMLSVMGNAQPARTTPFLTTAEMFKLKWGTPALSSKWLRATTTGRRSILAEELSRVPLPGVGSVATDEPRLIDEIEWFASARDMVRAMDWLRVATNGPAASAARGVLSVNSGGIDAKAWKFVSFKSGSEPGVLQLTWLLERPDGEWFVVTGGWNDSKSEVDLGSFVGLLARAVELCAQHRERRAY